MIDIVWIFYSVPQSSHILYTGHITPTIVYSLMIYVDETTVYFNQVIVLIVSHFMRKLGETPL